MSRLPVRFTQNLSAIEKGTRSVMKLKIVTRFVTGLLLLLVCGILASIDASAQNLWPLDLRDNLKLIKEIDLTNDEIYQTKFTERNEFFVVSRNRRTKEWTFRKDDVRHAFSPCSNNRYAGGTLNREGNRFSISCEDFSVEVWNLETVTILTRFNVRKVEKSKDYLIPYISSDGNKIVAEFGERAELWDVANGKKIAGLDSSATSCYCNRAIYTVEFSPDSKVVAVAFGGRVFLWNAENGKLLNRLIDKKPGFWGYDEKDQVTDVGSVRHLLFSKDSKTIITGSSIGVGKSWSVETGELLQRFKGHKLAVTSLALSPDEKILATGSRNQDFKLWDFETGKLILTSADNKKEVRVLSFSPDGRKLLSMTTNRAFIWETATGKILEQMPRPVSRPLLSHTWFSPDWRFVMMPNKHEKTIGLYRYIGQ